jgi:hypothetical protein
MEVMAGAFQIVAFPSLRSRRLKQSSIYAFFWIASCFVPRSRNDVYSKERQFELKISGAKYTHKPS